MHANLNEMEYVPESLSLGLTRNAPSFGMARSNSTASACVLVGWYQFLPSWVLGCGIGWSKTMLKLYDSVQKLIMSFNWGTGMCGYTGLLSGFVL